MSDTTRREFLKSAGFALAAIAVAGMSQAQPPEDKKKDRENEENKKKRDDDDLFGSEPEDKKEDEETRACPQCGAIMYRQGNTWTCDVCGYSYVE